MPDASWILPRIVLALLPSAGLLVVLAAEADEEGGVPATRARVAAVLLPAVAVLAVAAFVMSLVLVWAT